MCSDEPLFIDRDGDLFAHILNYLRYGSIELPESIPKAMFNRELDYYGIPENHGSVVQWKKNTLAEKIKDVKCQFVEAEKNKHILAIAVECFNRFNEESKEGREVSFYLERLNLGDDCREFWKLNRNDKKALKTLADNLEYFGLCVSIGKNVNMVSSICLKK